jgi:glycosyltransferase involved in cell wall biosynthesis
LKTIPKPLKAKSDAWPWTLPESKEAVDPADYPKLTVVTPSYNQGQFIEETIRSIIGQRYPNLEFIVMDGGSTDQTVSVLEYYDEFITHWESEPDEGQTHAINKGIRKASGDWIAYLNSDDIYYPGALEAVGKAANQTEDRWVAGHTQVYGEDGNYNVKKATNEHIDSISKWLTYGVHVPQHSSFVHRSVFDEYGLFNDQYQYAFDLEFYMRLASKGLKITIIDQILAGFRIHGDSKTQTSRIPFLNEQIAMLEAYRDGMSDQEYHSSKEQLFEMMADNLIYDVALKYKSMPYREAMDQLTRALTLVPDKFLSRHFWGAVKKVLF